jgi:hypothetical protein
MASRMGKGPPAGLQKLGKAGKQFSTLTPKGTSSDDIFLALLISRTVK